MRPAPARPIGEGSTEAHLAEPQPTDVRPAGFPPAARTAGIPAGGSPRGITAARRQTLRRGASGLACVLWAVTLGGCLPKPITNPNEVSLTEGRVRGIGVGDPVAHNLSPLPIRSRGLGNQENLFAVEPWIQHRSRRERRLFELDCCGGGAMRGNRVYVLAPIEADGGRRVQGIIIHNWAPAELEPQALIGVSPDGKVALFHTRRSGVYLMFDRGWVGQRSVREMLGTLFGPPDLATSGLLASDLKAPDSDEALVFAHADQAQAPGGFASRMAPYLQTRPPFLQFLEANAALMAQCTDATPETRAVCDQHLAPVVARHQAAWAEELAQLSIDTLLAVSWKLHRAAPLNPPGGPSLWERARALKLEAYLGRGQILTAAGVARSLRLPKIDPETGQRPTGFNSDRAAGIGIAAPRPRAPELLARLPALFPPVRVRGGGFGAEPKPLEWARVPGHLNDASPGPSGWVEVEIAEVDTIETQVSNTSLRTQTEFSFELQAWQKRKASLLEKVAKAKAEMEANRHHTQQVYGDVTGQRSTKYVNSEGREVFTVSTNESVRGLKYETNGGMKSRFEGAKIALAEAEAQISALGPPPVAPTRQYTSGYQSWSGALRWQVTVRGALEDAFDLNLEAAAALPAAQTAVQGLGDARATLRNLAKPQLRARLAERLRIRSQAALDRHLASLPEGPLRQEEAAWARFWRGEPPAAGDTAFGVPEGKARDALGDRRPTESPTDLPRFD